MLTQDANPPSADAPALGQVFFTLDGVEHRSPVPRGTDRWDIVAEALAERLRCRALAEDPPSYDAGARNWTLPITLVRRRGRREKLLVPVRW